MTHHFKVENPKRNSQDSVGRASWYPYYAGFSASFANSILTSASLNGQSRVLDPWNGGGTTTTAALSLGLVAHGYDLNPVMAVIAKARMLSNRTKKSVAAVAADIVLRCLHGKSADLGRDKRIKDPLSTWFHFADAELIRRIERSVWVLLVQEADHGPFTDVKNIDGLSDLACFFYVALFRSVRRLLRPFFSSNPTWVKKPKHEKDKLRLKLHSLLEIFQEEICYMVSSMDHDRFDTSLQTGMARASVASSLDLPDGDNSVHFILSSPPYCTRIDYAIATMPELAILGYSLESDLLELRRKLIGTPTVPPSVPAPSAAWGKTCNEFLGAIWTHGSKASRTYYYKNHFQYFHAIYQSLQEIQRVLVAKGFCVLVVQDSYYKDIRNDLPQVFIEMGHQIGLRLTQRHDFTFDRSLARINPSRRPYMSWSATESVLCFIKEGPKRSNDSEHRQ